MSTTLSRPDVTEGVDSSAHFIDGMRWHNIKSEWLREGGFIFEGPPVVIHLGNGKQTILQNFIRTFSLAVMPHVDLYSEEVRNAIEVLHTQHCPQHFFTSLMT